MTTTDLLQHGGNLADAALTFGVPKDGWLDLSTGISPFPYPVADLPPDAWTRLPGRVEETHLRDAALRAYSAPHSASIVMAPGTQILIQQLPRIFDKSCVIIRTPTYAEHAHCWRLAGHSVEAQSFDHLPGGADIVVVVNPNNPDGHTIPPETILLWADEMAARGGFLVVDEAFADVAPDSSVAQFSGRPGLIVLRSFGKFFGLAGLRLGFALVDTPIARRLNAALGPWVVSGPALQIGADALGDLPWQEQARQRLNDSSRRMDLLLSAHDIHAVGGTDLFRLLEDDRAGELYAGLASQGILTRAFDDQPRWLRLGLPANESQWQRLDQAFKSITR